MRKEDLNSVLFAGRKKAILALEDGTVFNGTSIGYEGQTTGEIVFNTSLSGYQEILTDPSYADQIVTLTYPHIGNTGCNSIDIEADELFIKGLVVRDLPRLSSSWRKQQELSDYLKRHKIVAIADLDTRELTNLLRKKGALKASIVVTNTDSKQAVELANSFKGLKNTDLAKVVSCKQAYKWNQSIYDLETNGYKVSTVKVYKVICYDYGVKQNILRIMDSMGCDIEVVPAQTSYTEVLAKKPDGVFLSNGPGDPAACDYAVESVKQILKSKIPLFGICLGHQILALASGAQTMKMKFGHHGANHPVQDIKTQEVMITSQNHGFAVDPESCSENLEVTHISLFDQSIQGIARKDTFAYSFQGHPEASPGPHDAKKLFLPFINEMKVRKEKSNA